MHAGTFFGGAWGRGSGFGFWLFGASGALGASGGSGVLAVLLCVNASRNNVSIACKGM